MTQDDHPPDSPTPIVTLGSSASPSGPGSESALTVLIAFGANFLVAIAKSWAAVQRTRQSPAVVDCTLGLSAPDEPNLIP